MSSPQGELNLRLQRFGANQYVGQLVHPTFRFQVQGTATYNGIKGTLSTAGRAIIRF